MPTPTKGTRFGGSPAHERLILANLAQSLFEHGRITTTVAKAKRLRPVAEKLITQAKRGTLASRRRVLAVLSDKDVVHKLFAEIGPSFATRDGGYTRIVKTMPRKGDNAPMAVIELIDEETVSSAASRVARASASRKQAEAAQTRAAQAEVPAEAGAGDAPAAQAQTAPADAEATDTAPAEADADAADAEATDTAPAEADADAADADGADADAADADGADADAADADADQDK